MTALSANSTSPCNPQLEAIIAGLQNRMAERQTSINTGDLLTEQKADQAIPLGLHNAANACPASSPEAKQGFRNATNGYSGWNSREERDSVALHVVKNVLAKTTLHGILLGAGTMTITMLATPATVLYDGTELAGGMIDNGDGASQFAYDTNGDGWVDHQLTVDNTTEEVTSSEPDSLNLEDVVKGVWHIVTDFF
ncbi:hypothetical protein FRC09_001804 [Ceratobasidium sp. 395]|nr:hypothetical protein FRC09_001804 [Ceratobasidium sp. 395]